MTLYSHFQEKRKELFDYCLFKNSKLGLYFCHYILRYQVTINDFKRFNAPLFIQSITFNILSWFNPKAAAIFYSNELSAQYDKLRQVEWDSSLVEKRDDAPKEENRARQVIENGSSDVNALLFSYHQLILASEKEYQKVEADKNILLQAKLIDREVEERKKNIDEERSLHKIHTQLMGYSKLITQRQSAIGSKETLCNHELKMTSLINAEREDRIEIEAIALALEKEQLLTKVVDIMSLWQQGFNNAMPDIDTSFFSQRDFLDSIARGNPPSLLNFKNSKLFVIPSSDSARRYFFNFENFVNNCFKSGLNFISFKTVPAKEMMSANLLLRLNKQDRSLNLTQSVRNGFFGKSCEATLKNIALLNPALNEQYKDASQKMKKALGGKHYVLKYGVQVYSELLKCLLTNLNKALEVTEKVIKMNQESKGTIHFLSGSIPEKDVPQYKDVQKKIEAALKEHQTYTPTQVNELNVWLDKMVFETLEADRRECESWQRWARSGSNT